MENSKKHISFKVVLFVSLIAIILGLSYVKLTYQASRPVSKTQSNAFFNPVTEKTLSPAESSAIQAEQQKNEIFFVVSGNVNSVGQDIIYVEGPNGTFKIQMSPGTFPVKNSQNISLSGIKEGDVVSVLFPDGIAQNKLSKGSLVIVDNLTVETGTSL